MSEEPGQNTVIQHLILNSSRLYTRRTVPASCYITLGPDEQATLYQKNRVGMMLYNTGS